MSKQQNALAVIRKRLDEKKSQYQAALPVTVAKYLTPDRIVRTVAMACSRSPKLLECTPDSILVATMDAVQLGLEPGSPLGHAYLVPYKNKNGRMEAQCIIGYTGYITLARRSGNIMDVTSELVYENDIFDLNLATKEITHKPCLDRLKGRGDWTCGYCIANYVDGGRHVEFMVREQIMRIKARSKARDFGPWVTDEEEMARKTIVRRARKYWPMSGEHMDQMGLAMQIDDGMHVSMDMDTIEIDASDIDPAEQLAAHIESDKPQPQPQLQLQPQPRQQKKRQKQTGKQPPQPPQKAQRVVVLDTTGDDDLFARQQNSDVPVPPLSLLRERCDALGMGDDEILSALTARDIGLATFESLDDIPEDHIVAYMRDLDRAGT